MASSSTCEAAPVCCFFKYVFLGSRVSAFLTSLLCLGLLLLGLLCGVPLPHRPFLTWLRPSQASSHSAAPRGFRHHLNTDELPIFLCSPDFSLLNSKPKCPIVCSTFPRGCHTGISKTCPSPTPDHLPQAWSPAGGFDPSTEVPKPPATRAWFFLPRCHHLSTLPQLHPIAKSSHSTALMARPPTLPISSIISGQCESDRLTSHLPDPSLASIRSPPCSQFVLCNVQI